MATILGVLIGARGSGKTALADMIAAGGYSLSAHMNERSFVRRAKNFLGDDTAQLTWGDGEITENKLRDVDVEEFLKEPHVQYLSQQFVETLCSVDGVTDELVSEIERVIFDAHPPDTRQGASNFTELMDAKAALGRQKRAGFEQSILETGDHMARERDKADRLKAIQAKVATLRSEIARDERSKKGLVAKHATTVAEEFQRVSSAVEAIQQRISQWDKQKGAVTLLKAHVEQHRARIARSQLRSLSAEHANASFNKEEWERFLTDFVGDVNGLIDARLTRVQKEIDALKGPAVNPPVVREGNQ